MGFTPPFARMKQIVREHFVNNAGPAPVPANPFVSVQPEVSYPDPSWSPEPDVAESVHVEEEPALSEEEPEQEDALPPDYKLNAMRRPDLDILAKHHGIVDPLLFDTKNQLIAALKQRFESAP